MSNVGLSHEQAARAYFGEAAASLSAPMQGYKLPKCISLPGKQPASFAAILEVGGVLAGGHKGEEDATVPEL